MIVIPVSNKTILVRHWFKWYRVMRGGTDWHRLKIEKRATPLNLSKVAKELQAKYGSKPLNSPILDEIAADKEVEKNMKKAGKKPNRKKGQG